MPDEITITIIELAGVIASIILGLIGLVVAILGVWLRWYPIHKEQADEKLLIDKFGRGPYDPETIKAAVKYYVWPQFANIDPGQEEEIRDVLTIARSDLLPAVDAFLEKDDGHRHLLILADSGMGKTSFVLNYFAHNARRKRPFSLAMVYLGLPNVDDEIRRHNSRDPQNTVLIMDAFDEDTRAIEDHHQRIRDLMELCRGFKRVIITCRTQFFPKEAEVPVETGIVKLGPRKAGDKGVYEFLKLYLSPFDDEYIEMYLRKLYPFWRLRQRRKAQEIIARIPLLSVRPMLLAQIPDLIESNVEIKHTYELYEVMIEAWLERESNWAKKDILRRFSERLAVDLYMNRETRGTERMPREELMSLADDWEIRLQGWQLSGRSLLNRDARGNYKFAHRSIMEYLFVRQLTEGHITDGNVELTDQMWKILVAIIGNEKFNPDKVSQLIEMNPMSDLSLFLKAAWHIQRSPRLVPLVRHTASSRPRGERKLNWVLLYMIHALVLSDSKYLALALRDNCIEMVFDEMGIPVLRESISIDEPHGSEDRAFYVYHIFSPQTRGVARFGVALRLPKINTHNAKPHHLMAELRDPKQVVSVEASFTDVKVREPLVTRLTPIVEICYAHLARLSQSDESASEQP